MVLCYESVGVCSLIAADVQKLMSAFEQNKFVELRSITNHNQYLREKE